MSIVNKDEMIFLHYLLTTRWHKDELKTYIGKSLHADTKINSNHNVGCHKQAHGPPQDITRSITTNKPMCLSGHN